MDITTDNMQTMEREGMPDPEIVKERYELVLERIARITEECVLENAYNDYFQKVAAFLLMIDETDRFIRSGGLLHAPLEELRQRNRALYSDILPESYAESYANPGFACEKLGERYGQLLSALYAELRSLIQYVHAGKKYEMLIRMELFAEVYTTFVCEREENGGLPAYESIHQIFYWFASDYADVSADVWTAEFLTETDQMLAGAIEHGELNDERYLYTFGDYISENETQIREILADMDEATINTMADTYTEGYRLGFVAAGQDLTKKGSAEVIYPIGFERVIRRAFANFRKLGLKPLVRSGAVSLLDPGHMGCVSTSPNRQFRYDHKDDRALFFDRNYMNRLLEVRHTALERYKAEARLMAGPAVMETFGEADFNPVNKPENLRMSEEQNGLWVEYRSKVMELQEKYIPEDERSFTIIAFPLPEIKSAFAETIVKKHGDAQNCYRAFFDEIIKINTLDYKLYQRIQQTMIDALNEAQYCEVKGMGVNRTDLRVSLFRLRDPEKETIFENCVADVNIPVGEIFTSPRLAGTDGVLHVSRVFLNGLEYRDLEITFADGMITKYACANFDREQENLDFIRENVLMRHKTLPIGEFAIGTNTTAYVVARRYGVESKLPILIAEKTGPHFAVGDTCYSHAEELRVYNPDGKEIVAKDNEVSALREEKPMEAYFNCHTDITIPYDELGELTGVRPDGTRIPIIARGRFVLPGTEELNRALDGAVD